jgi:hypothetical protein
VPVLIRWGAVGLAVRVDCWMSQHLWYLYGSNESWS